MKNKKMSDDALLAKFKILTEFNYKEHYMTFTQFMVRMLVSSGCGVLAGAIIQRIVKVVQRDKQSRYQCLLFLLLQFLIITSVFYVALRFSRTVDDWFTSTISGVLCGLAFFAAQPSVGTNATCVLN